MLIKLSEQGSSMYRRRVSHGALLELGKKSCQSRMCTAGAENDHGLVALLMIFKEVGE